MVGDLQKEAIALFHFSLHCSRNLPGYPVLVVRCICLLMVIVILRFKISKVELKAEEKAGH
jgi:hypothetical protein